MPYLVDAPLIYQVRLSLLGGGGLTGIGAPEGVASEIQLGG